METIMVFFGIGTNLGDRKQNIDQALELISKRMEIVLVSSIYETEPMGKTDQPRFLNLVCQVNTVLSPHELLTLVKGIELKLGRVTGELNGPRPIDIDILLYGDKIIDSPKLTIPHPRIAEREFVLKPFAEIASNTTHPVSGKTIRELKEALSQDQGVTLWRSEAVEE